MELRIYSFQVFLTSQHNTTTRDTTTPTIYHQPQQRNPPSHSSLISLVIASIIIYVCIHMQSRDTVEDIATSITIGDIIRRTRASFTEIYLSFAIIVLSSSSSSLYKCVSILTHSCLDGSGDWNWRYTEHNSIHLLLLNNIKYSIINICTYAYDDE